MNIAKQTKIWGMTHPSLLAVIMSLAASGCVTSSNPEDYTLCEPVPPATDCGDDVEIEVE